MKVINYIKENFNLDLIANMLVYPDKVSDMGGSYELWKAKDVHGKDIIFEYTKEDAIKKTKEYLESEIGNINWLKEK